MGMSYEDKNIGMFERDNNYPILWTVSDGLKKTVLLMVFYKQGKGRIMAKPRNIAEARDFSAALWAEDIAEGMEVDEEMYIPPQVNRIFMYRGKERSTLVQTGHFLKSAGLETTDRLNYWIKRS